MEFAKVGLDSFLHVGFTKGIPDRASSGLCLLFETGELWEDPWLILGVSGNSGGA